MIELIADNYENKIFLIKISLVCLQAIESSIELTLNLISHSFHARLGYYCSEVILCKEKISEAIKLMQANKPKDENSKRSTNIEFNVDEMLIINQCLNEVCNGLKIDDFENKVGVDKTLARDWLNKVNSIIIQFQSNSRSFTL